MEYYMILLDPYTVKVRIETDMHDFRVLYNSFEEADSMGAEYIHSGDCGHYEVVQTVKD